ncbi:MAG: alpha/beta hydrolase [Fulvivirga sp.]
MTASINFRKHTIQYHKIGNGSKIMLAFHGFGQTGEDFIPLGKVIAKDFTIYSFDLFYHGKSYWSIGNERLTKRFWRDFISEFTTTHDINNFSLCGFSLGAKFALATLEAYPERVEKIVLIAPDGIKTRMWYSLATYPIILKSYFKSMIVKPQRFFNLVNLLKKTGLMEKGILKFATNQMNTIKKRRRVYYAWVVFKELSFDIKKISKLINKFDIETTIFLGRHDKIITQKGMKILIGLLRNYKLHILDSGHNRLIEKVAEWLKAGS